MLIFMPNLSLTGKYCKLQPHSTRIIFCISGNILTHFKPFLKYELE